MTGSAHLGLTFGGLLLAGGIAGYLRAKSVPSLVAGSLSGLSMISSGFLIQDGHEFEGHVLGAATSGIVSLAMARRFSVASKAGKATLIPITVAGIALLVSIYSAKKAQDWYPTSESQ